MGRWSLLQQTTHQTVWGDNLQAHTANRVSIVRMSKPSFKEWAAWATDKGISPLITACCAMYPQVFRSYTEGDTQDNPYIFNPKRADQTSFVSPRSLHKSDDVSRRTCRTTWRWVCWLVWSVSRSPVTSCRLWIWSLR
jgi:hypothetical protein